MSALVIPGLHVDERVHSRVLQSPLACGRQGIMLHYDDSSDDRWSIAWFRDPACTNGYTWLAMDDGRLIELADPGMRTPHAGPCLTKNANSAYYGLAAATNGKVPVTDAQLATIVECCLFVFRYHQWTAAEVETRITGHDVEAVWTSAYTTDRTRWGRVGRKVDPTGQRADGAPVLSLADVQREVFLRLPEPVTA